MMPIPALTVDGAVLVQRDAAVVQLWARYRTAERSELRERFVAGASVSEREALFGVNVPAIDKALDDAGSSRGGRKARRRKVRRWRASK